MTRFCEHCHSEIGDSVTWGKLLITEAPLAAYWAGIRLDLRPAHIRVLMLLARGRATHVALEMIVIGENADPNTVKVHVCHLRRRLEQSTPLKIECDRKVGYRLIDTDRETQPSPIVRRAA